MALDYRRSCTNVIPPPPNRYCRRDAGFAARVGWTRICGGDWSQASEHPRGHSRQEVLHSEWIVAARHLRRHKSGLTNGAGLCRRRSRTTCTLDDRSRNGAPSVRRCPGNVRCSTFRMGCFLTPDMCKRSGRTSSSQPCCLPTAGLGTHGIEARGDVSRCKKVAIGVARKRMPLGFPSPRIAVFSHFQSAEDRLTCCGR